MQSSTHAPMPVPNIEVFDSEDDQRPVPSRQSLPPYHQTISPAFHSPRLGRISIDIPELKPSFSLRMPSPIVLYLHAHEYKYNVLSTFFVKTGQAPINEQIQIYAATHFWTFEVVLRQRLCARRSPREVELGAEGDVVKMKIRLVFRVRGARVEKKVVATLANWEGIKKTIVEGRGTSFEVDYVMKEGASAT